MASVNQTRPHCVNQIGKTHSKPLVARHGRGTAWARQGHSMGTAWARHAMCESAFRVHRSSCAEATSASQLVARLQAAPTTTLPLSQGTTVRCKWRKDPTLGRIVAAADIQSHLLWFEVRALL